MAETSEDFSVHRFIQDLFEDLSLTLPSLGTRFNGTATPNTLTAQARRSWLKNKVFLLFADIAVASYAQGAKELVCRFTISKTGSKLEWCFFCVPEPVELTLLSSWDPEVFLELSTAEGRGFSVLVDPGKPLELGPPINWQELSRLYGSADNGRRVLDLFLQRCEELIPALDERIRERNGQEVLRISHTLKGSARGVTAQSFSHAALQLEMLGRSGDFSQAQELYKALMVTYDEVTSWVQEGRP